MRKRLLTLGLAVILGLSSIVVPTSRVSAYTISKDGPIKYIKEVSPEGIAKLNEIAIESDLEMLDDIVERSYNNNFDIKSYVIKSKNSKLDSTYWRNYLISRGDTYLSVSFDRNNIVYDENTGYYYHSIKVEAIPAWEVNDGYGNGYFDYKTRKITLWDDYIDIIRKAEREIGYIEGGNLCDYELLWGAYCWMARNIKYGTPDVYSNQSVLGAVFGHTPTEDDPTIGRIWCAGYARLLNRFCHDFGIDSYWVSIPSMSHAVNFVKLNNEYYDVDFNRAIINKNYDYSQNNTTYYTFDRIYGILNEELTSDYFKEAKSVLHYSSNFVNSENPIASVESFSTIEDNHFNQPGPRATAYDDVIGYDNTETCGHCGQKHYFPYDSETATVPTKVYPTIEHSYSFEGTEDGMDWYGNYTEGAFTIYQDGRVFHSEVNEKETTTEELTTPAYEEPTTEYVDVEPSTTAPDYEVPTTVSRPEQPTSNRVVTVPTKAETSTTPEEKVTTTKKPEETTTTKVTVKPGKVKKVTAKNNKKKSIKLTWKKATNAKKYQIQYSTSKKFKKKVVTKATKKLKYTIKRLAKGKTYYIRVRGVNGKEVGKWSTIKKVKSKKYI